MSKFSGKCDFADHIEIVGLENTLKSTVFIGNIGNEKKLELHEYRDLIPYFPHLISVAGISKVGNSVIHLTTKSYVDIREEESLNFKLKQVLNYYKKCKRNNIKFDEDECLKKMYIMEWDKGIYTEIIERVKQYGNKANTNGMHLYISEYYRKKLADEMLANSIDPSLYGLERFVNNEFNKNYEW